MTDRQLSHPHHRLGDFELIRELGRGGMGVVYEARQVSLNRKVALKVLASALGLSSDAILRFRREAEAAARLHHTNIVPVYATGEQDGMHFYAMELMEGPSLDQFIRETRATRHESGPTNLAPGQDDPHATVPHQMDDRIPDSRTSTSTGSSHGSSIKYFDQVARLIADVADALSYAHRQGIVHRDIKPSNLLMSPDGRLSLNDFGLARVLEQPGMTATGEMLGTPAYMSPEQITAGRTPLDHRTDIYSLGATLYELLTLQPPFRGERRDQLLAQILHKDPVPPRRLDKKIPVDLETICLKAMDKDPDRRYQTGSELAEDLRRYVNRFAVLARRTGFVGKFRKSIKRHPGLAAGSAFGTVTLIVALAFGYQARLSEQRRLAEQRQAQRELARVARDDAVEDALVAAMSGSQIRAEQAIARAQSQGASNAQVSMLRGHVAHFLGDYDKALAELELAAELEPQSVATRGLLSLTYSSIGDWNRGLAELQVIMKLNPESNADLLFKAYAYASADHVESIRLLDESIQSNDSPLGRAIRADVRSIAAFDSRSLAESKKSLADVRAAKDFLPDNCYVQSINILAHVVAAKLHGELGQKPERQEALAIATAEAMSLERIAPFPGPAYALVSLYDETGDFSQQQEILRATASNSDAPAPKFHYALSLCLDGRFDEAKQVLDSRRWRELDGDRLYTYVLAELSPNDINVARRSNEEMRRRYTGVASWSPCLSPLELYRRTLYLLGMPSEAKDQYRAVRQGELGSLDRDCQSVLRFGSDELSDDGLLNTSPGRQFRFFAHHQIGLRYLSQGDRQNARRHFLAANELRMFPGLDAGMVRLFLKRMDEDPSWPKWIPFKD